MQQEVISVMRMETFWSQPLYSITDTMSTQIRVTARRTIPPSADACGNGQNNCLSHSRPSVLNCFILLTSGSSKLSHQNSRLLSLIGQLIQRSSTTDHLTGKTNHFHQPTDPLHTTQWTLAIRRNYSFVQRVFRKNQMNEDKIQMLKMRCGVLCWWSLLQDVPHKIAFLRLSGTTLGEGKKAKVKWSRYTP
jgi:hypothetical protein